jgi:rhamnose utilization protein RhaD (predicted bifunctional aldolase and dehydrogenase)
MNKSLIELIKISHRVGRDPDLTQGGSGNTSVKPAPDQVVGGGKCMFIKASGTALGDMSAKKGWCKINLQKVREIIGDKKLNKLPWQKREIEIARRLLAACEGKKNRPSIETNLHAFLDKYVIHLHPTVAGAFVSSKNGKAELKKLFITEKLPPLWIPYASPGYSLAKQIMNLTGRYRKKHKCLPQILFLEKHGLFISASKPTDALKLVRKVINRCSRKLIYPAIKQIKKPDAKTIRKAKQIIKDAFFATTGQHQPVHFFHNEIISTFANRTDTGRLLKGGAVNPNEIIYTNGPAIWLKNPQKEKLVSRFKKRKSPIAILVKNLGLFVIGSTKTASIAEKVVCSSLFIRYNAQRLGGIAALTKSEQDFISNCGE